MGSVTSADADRVPVGGDGASRGSVMLAEIAEQPAVMEGLLHRAAAEIEAIRKRVTRFSPLVVMFAGRGTSGHAASYGKTLVETHLRVPAGMASPSTLTVYGARQNLRRVLFIAVSQSGRSPDLLEMTAAAGKAGALTVAVTNDPHAPLATTAHLHIDLGAGPERAVAATKTYTAQLLALYLLLRGEDTDGLVRAAEETLAHADEVDQAAQRYRFTDRLVTLSRGLTQTVAQEAALKLMETSYISAQAFSTADLLHGPIAMVGPDVPAIAVSGEGPAATAMEPILERLVRGHTDVLRVGGRGADLTVSTGAVVQELHPVLHILPLQRLAWRISVERGEDPDAPRGLQKVTKTW